ncbi:MAG: S9 family peptidase [Rhizomicrobium sp.]
MNVTRLLCAGLLALIPLAGHAGTPLTPKEALDYQRVGDLHFSPDGRQLAFVALSYDWDWQQHLRVLDVASGAAREITPAGKTERAPRWSPDGTRLAFLSNRGGKTQVYVMAAAGGEPTALTDRKNGVADFRWSPDGRSIACLARSDDAPDEDSGPQIADSDSALERLWIVDVASKASRALATPGYRIDEFAWRGADALLLLATNAPRVEEFNTAVYDIATTGGPPRLVAHPPQPMEALAVSPDGARFAVRATRANGPLARDLFVGAVGGGDPRDATAGLDRTIVETRWHAPGTIWARVSDGFFYRLYRIDLGGKATAIGLPLSAGSFDVARDGSIAFVGEDFTHPAQIFLRAPDGRIRPLGRLAQPAAAHLARTTIFTTRSFDGLPIEAALMTPPASKGKSPLILLVHGGPSSKFAAQYGWETAWAEMLASHGYAVLMVNPRGSDGYGEDFVKANRADWGGGDYRDLMAVLDAVIARGGVDPARLGIGGWSYGGEMSEWAIGQSDRFKAAVVGAGVFDQAAEFETEHDPAGDEWYFGTPWENPDVFARNSPSSHIRDAHTPALIFDGADDASNPVGQSKGLYRALKHFGVETQLVLYPGEGHSPRKGADNIDMFQRILDWYDRHLAAQD